MPIWWPGGTQGDIPGAQSQAQVLRSTRATKRVDQSIPHSIDPRGKQGQQNPIPFPGGLMAVTNSAITACSGSGNTRTPGTGTVDLFYVDSPDATTASRSADTSNQACINWYVNNGNSINAGINCVVILSGYNLLMVGADCTN